MTDVFISYAREDQAFVRTLFAALEEHQRDAWVDWEGIPPTADWVAEIHGAIDSADTFLFVMSPDSLASAICLQEVEHAVSRNKRLVPVVRREAEGQEAPAALARLNWIFLRHGDDFGTGIATLFEALDTDLDHVKLHTRYLERAADWERKTQDPGLTLRGQDLEAAEHWLAESGGKEPLPTSAHNRYILASRRVTTKRQRITLASIAVAVLVATVLGLFAVQQRNAKRLNRERAIANQLVGESDLARDEREDALAESVQLAAEAMRRLDALGERSRDADRALRVGLALLPRSPESNDLPYLGEVRAAAFSPRGRHLAFATTLGNVRVWDTLERAAIGTWKVELAAGDSFRQAAVTEDGVHAATWLDTSSGRTSRIALWDVAQGVEAASCERDGRFSGSSFELGQGGRWWIANNRIWRLSDCQEVVLWDDSTVVSGLTLSDDGRRVAASVRQRGTRGERWIEIRDVESGAEVARWRYEGLIGVLRFLGDGRRLAGLEFNSLRLQIWEIESPEQPLDIAIPGPVIAIRGDGRLVATRKQTSSIVKVRAASTAEEILRLVHPSQTRLAAFSPDGRRLTTFDGRVVRRWDLNAGRAAASPGPRSPGHRLAFGGNFLAAAAADAVRLWRVADWTPVAELATSEPAATLAFDGEVLTFGDEAVRFRAAADGWEAERETRPPRSDPAADLDFEGAEVLASTPCPGAGRLAVTVGTSSRGGWQARTELWDTARRERLASFDLVETVGEGMKGIDDRSVGLLVCSADNRLLALPARDAAVIRKIESGRQVARLSHPGLRSVAFAPGGEVAATAGRGAVRLWQLGSSTEIARLLDGEPVADLAFSPDGRYLATAGAVGIDLFLWQPRDLIAEACSRLERNLAPFEWERLFPDDPYVATCPQLESS